MATSIANLAVILSASSAQLGADLQRARGMVGQFGGAVNKEFDKIGDEIAKTWRKLDPTEIKRQAGLQLLKDELASRMKREVEAQKEKFAPTLEEVQPTLQEQAAKILADRQKQKELNDEVKRQSILNQPLRAPELPSSTRGGEVGRFGKLGYNLASPIFGGKSSVTQTAGKLGMGLDKALAALGAFTPHLAIATAAIGAFAGVAITAHKSMVAFASFANPAAADRYKRAWDDMTAVIGHRMVPYLNFASQVVRNLGDFLQTVLPPTSEMKDLFEELKPVLVDFRDSLKLLAAFIKVTTPGLYQKGSGAAAGGALRGLIGGGILGSAGMLARVLGVKDLESSVGAAPRAAHFVGIEELSKQNIAMGFSQGQDPATKTAENTEKTASTLERIAAVLVPGPVGNLVTAAIRGLSSAGRGR